MNKLMQDFVSMEERVYQFKIGKIVASSLTGFIAGIIVASFIWAIILSAQQ